MEELLACNPEHLQKLEEDAYTAFPSTLVCRICSQASGKVHYVQLESPGGTCVAKVHCLKALHTARTADAGVAPFRPAQAKVARLVGPPLHIPELKQSSLQSFIPAKTCSPSLTSRTKAISSSSPPPPLSSSFYRRQLIHRRPH